MTDDTDNPIVEGDPPDVPFNAKFAGLSGLFSVILGGAAVLWAAAKGKLRSEDDYIREGAARSQITLASELRAIERMEEDHMARIRNADAMTAMYQELTTTTRLERMRHEAAIACSRAEEQRWTSLREREVKGGPT